MFIGFVPAVSGDAAKAMGLTVRRGRLHHRNDLKLEEVVLASSCPPGPSAYVLGPLPVPDRKFPWFAPL
jgi:hypothetical protein